MTGLAEIFAELGISQYLQDFVDQGFDTWETILDIKESDFDALGVKLGHRRKLQRKIANARGISTDRALESPSQSGPDGPEDVKTASSKDEGKEHGPSSGNTQSAKRKYRRHPKTDENAPDRPPSAYVIFSNKMRDDLKGRNLSFTEIAKLVGEHWQNLSPHEKEPYESNAAGQKEKYLSELAEYKKTEQYREYTAYLVEFKARQQNQNAGSEMESAKRPKLESQQPSANSTNTTSSGGSYSHDTAVLSRDGSVSAMHWPGKDQTASPAGNAPHLNRPLVAMKSDPGSLPLSGVLPGYRESIIYGAGTSSLAWRDGSREDQHNPPRIPPLAPFADKRSAMLANPRRDALPPLGALSSNPPPQSNPPSLITHESTNSNASSGYPQPPTPLESPGDRTLPPIYPPKLPGQYEVSLPSIRPPSLSPQTSVAGQLHSPNALVHPDYSFARGYGRPPPHGLSDQRSAYSSSNNSEETLQPFSTLLKAVNTVTRNSQQNP